MNNAINWKTPPDLSKHFNKETFEMVKALREKRFRLKDTAITPYVFNQWKKYGLINVPTLDDNRKWVSLSFGDWIWVKVIDDLRKFGCSVQDILTIKNNILFNSLDLASEEIKKSFDETIYEQLEKGKILSKEQIEEAKKYLKQKNIGLKDLLQQEPQQVNFLESAILYILLKGSDAHLILYLSQYIKEPETNAPQKVLVKERHRRLSGIEGYIYFPEYRQTDYKGDLDKFFSIPYICIPLKRYIVDFITTVSIEKELESLNLLSNEELLLLREMRKGKVKRIVIHYSKDKIDRIEVTRPLEKAQETRLAETFLSSEHADIEYTVAKGQIVKFEKTTKIKPN